MKLEIRSLKSYLLLFFVFCLMTINYTGEYLFGINLFNVIIGIGLFLVSIDILYSRRIKMGGFFSVYLTFFIWSFLTRFWAVSHSYYKLGMYSMFLTLLIMFILSNLIKDSRDIELVFWAIAWAGVLMFLYFSTKFGLLNIIYIRSRVGQINLNANIYGLCSCFSSLSFLYLYIIKHKQSYLILSLIMLLLSFLSGSRKVILLFVVVVLGIYLLSRSKRTVYRFSLIFIALLVIYPIIMNNEWLYSTIGVRVKEILDFFSDKGVAKNTSTGIRSSMIELGVELFRQKPILGYGVMGTYVYNGDTYLHNNYVELLVNTGLVGTIIYYFRTFILLIKEIKSYIFRPTVQLLYFLLLLVALLIMDFSIVSYNERIILLILMTIFKAFELDYFRKMDY